MMRPFNPTGKDGWHSGCDDIGEVHLATTKARQIGGGKVGDEARRLELKIRSVSVSPPVIKKTVHELSLPVSSDELNARLQALLALGSALVPDRDLGFEVCSADGTLVISVGHGRFRFPRHGTPGDDAVMTTAYSKIDTADGPALTLAVRAFPHISQPVLDHLCATGSLVLTHAFETASLRDRLGQANSEKEALVERVDEGCLILDRNGTLRHLNAAGAQILGIDAAKGVGTMFSSHLGFEPLIMPIFSTRVGHKDFELKIKLKGKDLYLSDTAIPITNPAGEVVSIVNTFVMSGHDSSLSGFGSGRLASLNGSESQKRIPSLEDAERDAIRLALRETNLNLTKAANALGISRPTLYAKLDRYGLRVSSHLVEDRAKM